MSRPVYQSPAPAAAGEPFLRSARALARVGDAVDPVPVDDLLWEPVVAGLRRWLPRSLRAILRPAIAMSIRKSRPVDLDGQAIYLDEHDAPFILLASGKPVYVHVYRFVRNGVETLLTAPNPDPARRYLSPEDRTRLALRHLLEDAGDAAQNP